MPRHKKGEERREVYTVRLPPSLVRAVRRTDVPLTTATEQALQLWLERREFRQTLTPKR